MIKSKNSRKRISLVILLTLLIVAVVAIPTVYAAPGEATALPEGQPPEGEMPPDVEMPEGAPPEGEMPEGMTPPEGEMPEGAPPEGEMPEGEMPEGEMPEGEPGLEAGEVPEEAFEMAEMMFNTDTGDEVKLGFNVESFTLTVSIIVAVVAVAIIAYMIIRIIKRRKAKKLVIALLCIALAIVVAFNFAIFRFNIVVNQFMSLKGDDSQEVKVTAEASRDIVERLEAEGAVLLKNEGGTLPLDGGTKINTFGYTSVAISYGGAGSGAGDESKAIKLDEALKQAGFSVNQDLIDFYNASAVEKEEGSVHNMMGNDFNIREVPISEYGNVMDEAKDFSDIAIVVITRAGGEGADLPIDMAEYEGGTAGRHYLELTENEEDMLEAVSTTFETVIVLVNSSHAMELGYLENSDIDAALWIGGPGATGLNAVADILAGEVNPSGRLADIYAYDATSSPAYYNFGDFTYTNASYESEDMMFGGTTTSYQKFVNYAEGIYIGYRYYETRYVDNQTGLVDEQAYNTAVQYPFGYGLSYTTFEQQMGDLVVADGVISVDVTVTNTGDVAGKEVVQIYYTAPYYDGGIEKSHVVLAAFDKTDILAAGESQTLTLTFNVDEMASFDYMDAGAYVLEEGDYQIKLMNNSHDVIDSKTFSVSETMTYKDGEKRDSDLIAAETAFEDVQGDLVYVSRADWEKTLPTERTKDKEASQEVIDAFMDRTVIEIENAEPIVIKDNGLALIDMVGLDYDDPKWDDLLEQLSVEDMEKLIVTGGYQTIGLSSVSKPNTVDIDGPAGLNALVSGLQGVHYCSEVVIASTWNINLVEEMGQKLGAEATANGVNGLYGPGANIHRTPFSGRNMEYYSEDGLLSGEMAAAMIRGSMSEGVYTFVKHYALNDQETNRTGVCTWSNEQAIREIYLKPFEIAVKDGGTTAVMSAMNNIGTSWVGASKALCTTTLREEWGFEGMIVTDAYGAGGVMDISMGIAVGNDLALSVMGGTEIRDAKTSDSVQQQMRQASKNILYTVANSNVFENIDTSMPSWLWLIVAFDAVALALIALGLIKATGSKKDKNGTAKVENA